MADGPTALARQLRQAGLDRWLDIWTMGNAVALN
jgi:hypothetical protein